MSHPDQGAGVYTTEMAKQNRRRRQVVTAVAGLALVLGGGAYATTAALTTDDKIAPDPAALAPVAPAESETIPQPSELPSVAPSQTATKSVVKPSKSPTRTPSISTSMKQRIDAARSANAVHGTEVRPPLPQAHIAEVPPEDIKVTNTGTLNQPGGTMRLVTARGDMTGQKELGWVADEGEKYGEVRCSQNFRFSAGMAPTKKPTLLICWRTSAEKSVYTVAVKLDGPNPATSVALVDKEWAKLG